MSLKTTCKTCSSEFEISDSDLTFYKDISPTFNGRSFPIPAPTLCPDCRLQRRFSFRNERCLYKRKSCLSSATFLTTFSPEAPFKVCSYDEWWSDKWDPLSYGKTYDTNRPFFEQLLELSLQVPHCPLYLRNAHNSEYGNYSLNLKDCYLVFGTTDCDHCLYGKSLAECRDVMDSLAVIKSELCYEGIGSEGCYNCQFFSQCFNCTDCFMVEECEACTNCALCYGLHRREYYVKNQFVGKAAFEKFMSSVRPLNNDKIELYRTELAALAENLPHRESYCIQSENCSGNNISHSKNCHWCFDINNCEDSKFLFWTPKAIRSHDCSYNSPDGVELCFEACSTLGTRSMGTFMCWNNDSAYYSMECHYNRDIFGCIGVRNKQYCFLNKQYSREDYEKLVSQAISELIQKKQWGQFLPKEMSYFCYDETIAQEYFPIDLNVAAALKYKWRGQDKTQAINAIFNLPDTIEETEDSIIEKTVICQQSGRAYRINPSELNLCRKFQVPLPIKCPDVRHLERLSRRSPLTLWKRQCHKTGKGIMTSYPPGSKMLVYSNEAFKEYFYQGV